MHYEQQCTEQPTLSINDKTITFAKPPPDLAFDDDILEQVKEAWKAIMNGEEEGDGFLKFPSREDLVGGDEEEENAL